MNDAILQLVESLKTKVSELNFNNWIKPATFSSLKLGLLKIEVPNKFIRDWITENYLHLIKYELFKITNAEHEVIFELLPEEPQNLPKKVEVKSIQESSRLPELFSPKYTFETFVVGSSNQFARAAAMRARWVRLLEPGTVRVVSVKARGRISFMGVYP